jgi:hypothetical protein
MDDNSLLQAASSSRTGQSVPPAASAAFDIATDVSLRLRAAGRPAEEADAGGQIIAAHYAARAARFEFQRGTAADLYQAEAPDIVGGHQQAWVEPQTGKVQIPDRTLFQSTSAPIYETTGLPHLYSGVARAVNALTQAKGSGEQMLAMLSRTPGVKPEEMRWLGLDAWLRAQERVSKEQIQHYIWANALQLREVVKGSGSKDWVRLYEIEADARDRLRSALPETLSSPVGNGASTPDDVTHAITMGWARPDDLPAPYRDAARAYVAAMVDLGKLTPAGGDPKYETQTLPGGSNYREILITLPAETDTRGWTAHGIEAGNGRRHVAIRDAAGNNLGAMRHFAGTDEEAIERYAHNNRQADAKGTYRSDHWDEPNVLAHVRLNERMAPDGKRVLLIEEIQSDWHQSGRKGGYKTGNDTTEHPLKATWIGGTGGVWEVRTEGGQYITNVTRSAAETEQAALAVARQRIASEPARVGQDNRVPDAPFKTSWPALAMKRMIAYAVDHGFDRVAWLPGEVQSARYSLAKHVDELVWYPTTQDLQGFKDRREVVFQKGVPQHKLPDHVGKEVADRLLNAPTKTSPDGAGGVNHVLSGQDLQVGGEGMNGFYDTILPAETQKLVGKFGARVGISEIPRGVTDKERESIEPDAEALAKYGTQFDCLKTDAGSANERALMWGLNSAGGPEKKADFDRADALYERLAELRNTMIGETIARLRQPVHSFDVTDDLRAAVLSSGLTLFQEARGQIRFNDGGRSVITLFSRADASTFLHETAHEWLRELLRDAAHPQAPASLTKDATTVREWLGADPDGPITRQQHERFARAFERYMMEGQAPSAALAEVFARFRDWLVSLYRSVERLGAPITPEIRNLFDRMLTATPERQPVIAPAAPGQEDAPRGGPDSTGPNVHRAPGATSQTAAGSGSAGPQTGGQQPPAGQPRPVLDTLLSGLRSSGAGGGSLWETTVPVADRLAAFEKRTTDERDDATLKGAVASGRAALDALKEFNNREGSPVISRIRQAAGSDPDGLAGVVSEMHAGGRFAGLLGQFTTALDCDRGLAGAYDRAAAALFRYGKDRGAVEDVIARRPDGDAITARFQPMDAAIGEAAAAMPSRAGHSMLEDQAQKAAGLLRRAVEAVAPPANPAARYTASASMGQ